MKKFIFSLAAFVVAATMSVSAERGKLIHVDISQSKNLKPQIAFAVDRVNDEDVTTLLVKTVNVNAYNEFNDESRILLRFADESKPIRLNKVAGSAVDKNKHTEKKGNATISFYDTFTSYEVTPEVIKKLEAGIGISKVRIVFKENEHKDYEIVEGYQAKMAADLLKSYQEAALKNKKAHSDTSDEDF